METVEVSTEERVQIKDITQEVRSAVDIQEGISTVFVRHTTAAITINEAEERLKRDIVDTLEQLIPENAGYEHDEIDSNADAHLRSMLLNSEVSIPVTEGELALGTWQSIMLFEGDGPRSRTIIIASVGE